MIKQLTILWIFMLNVTMCYPQDSWEQVFFDDFQSGEADNWTLEEGWSVQEENGNYVLLGEGHTWARCSVGHEWTDYSFKCGVKIQQGAIHVNFRVSERGRYFLSLSQEEIRLTRDSLWGHYRELDVRAISFTEGVWHKVEIIANEKAIQVYVNDELQIQVWDENALFKGSIAFETLESAIVSIDSVVVAGPPQPEPPEGYDWFKTGGPPGGLGYDIRIHPENDQIVFVTDNPSGVNISYDGGINWVQSNNGITARTGESQEDIPVFSLTIDPGNPDRIWCGTQNTKGIFRSDDCGITWVRMDKGVTEDIEISFRGFAIHPENSDIVLAAAEIATVEQGITFNKTKGKIYKTIDGGDNWYPVWEGDNLARVLLYDYHHPDTVYCSTGIFDREAYNSDKELNLPGGVGILKSSDGGESWFTINNGIDNLYTGFLEIHPEDPRILYTAAGNHAYRIPDGGIFKTTDGGEHWSRMLEGDCFSAVTVSRSRPDLVYAFGEGACYRTTDGGNNWTIHKREGEYTWGPPGIKPGIPISAAVDSTDENKVFVNNYNGGNFLSRDGGINWVNASKGYTGADIRDLEVNPEIPSELYVVGRNGAFKSVNGGGSWFGITNGAATTEFISICPLQENFGIAYGISDADLAVIRTTDGGESWQSIFSLGPTASEGNGFHRFSKVAVSQSDPSVLYTGMSHIQNIGNIEPDGQPGYGIFKSTDTGQHWFEINTGLDSLARIITTLAIHPHSPDTVYAGTLNDGIYKTVDGGQQWFLIPNGLGSSDIRSISIDPENPDILYAGSGNGFGIYKSVDGGENWTPSNYGIQLKCPTYLSAFGRAVEGMSMDTRNPFLTGQDYESQLWTKVLDIAIDPANPKNVYAADYGSGIYYSPDRGESWAKINNGLTFKEVTSLTISGDGTVLYTGTSGAGVFRMVLANKAPGIEYAIPGTADTVTIYQGDSLDFEIKTFDLNNDTIIFAWYLDGVPISYTNSEIYNLKTGDLYPGYYSLEATVSDGDESLVIAWVVEVRAMPTSDMDILNQADQPGFIEIFPNPFTESVRINYFLPDQSEVSIDIYGTNGQKVKSLSHGYQQNGLHALTWNGMDQNGSKVTAGVYICRFVFHAADGLFVQERKIIHMP